MIIEHADVISEVTESFKLWLSCKHTNTGRSVKVLVLFIATLQTCQVLVIKNVDFFPPTDPYFFYYSLQPCSKILNSNLSHPPTLFFRNLM